MKGLILLHLALFIFFSVNSQESSINNLLISISWEEDYIQKKAYSHTVNSIEAYCFVNDTTIALLNSEKQIIIVYSLITKYPVEIIPLPYGSIDFDYYDGCFYILDYNKIYIINKHHKVEKEIQYQVPERTPFALEKFKVIDGRNIITIADGTTWEVGETGLKMIDEYYWYFSGGEKLRAEKLSFDSFELSVNYDNTLTHKSIIYIKNLGLTGYLATIKTVNINDHYISFV